MMVDFHSHILPGIDDGSKSVEQSLKMLRLEWQQGIRVVAATPHFYADRDNLEAFLRRRDRAAEGLRQAMTGDMPQLLLGAEVRFFRGISDCEVLSKLAIADTQCVLIEMPPAPWPESYYRELEAIRRKQGLTPIIAHVDRYLSPLRTYGIPKRLAQLPVLVQANGEFFLTRSTASRAKRMLQNDQIHLLGSDCHNLTDRKPNLGQARDYIEKQLGQSALSRVSGYERAVLGVYERME